MGSEVTAKSMSEDALHILIYDPLPPMIDWKYFPAPWYTAYIVYKTMILWAIYINGLKSSNRIYTAYKFFLAFDSSKRSNSLIRDV
jgi:hypothetical protein